MAKGRYINTHFWDDSYIIELDPIEKLLFLYILTNPCTDIAGAYEISLRRIAFDTGIDREMIIKVLKRFEDAGKIVYRDGWVLVINWLKNQSMNPSVKAGAERNLENCPAWIKDRILNGLDSVGTGCPQDALPNLTKPNPTQPNADAEEVVEQEAPRTNGFSKTPPPYKPGPQDEINTWLDAIAPLTGAKNRKTLANPKGWREFVEACLIENRDLSDVLKAVSAEITRTKATPQFFTPAAVLKIIQSRSVVKQSNGGFYH